MKGERLRSQMEMYSVDPPLDLIPKNLSDALVEIGKLQVYIRNQEQKLSNLEDDLDSEKELREKIGSELSTLKTQLGTGWKMVLGLGAFTLSVSAFFYNLKDIVAWMTGK